VKLYRLYGAWSLLHRQGLCLQYRKGDQRGACRCRLDQRIECDTRIARSFRHLFTRAGCELGCILVIGLEYRLASKVDNYLFKKRKKPK